MITTLKIISFPIWVIPYVIYEMTYSWIQITKRFDFPTLCVILVLHVIPPFQIVAFGLYWLALSEIPQRPKMWPFTRANPSGSSF